MVSPLFLGKPFHLGTGATWQARGHKAEMEAWPGGQSEGSLGELPQAGSLCTVGSAGSVAGLASSPVLPPPCTLTVDFLPAVPSTSKAPLLSYATRSLALPATALGHRTVPGPMAVTSPILHFP